MSAIVRRARAHGAPVTQFDLDAISGLVGWWRASTLALADGDPISTWTDASGAGHDLTASGTARPTWKAAIVNGHAVARFDGSTDAMSVATFSPGTTTAITVLAVLSATGSTDSIIAELSNNFNTNAGTFILWHNSTNTVSSGCRQTVFSVCTSTRTLTTTPRVVAATYDFSLSTAETVNWIDGGQGGLTIDGNNSGNFGTTYPLRVGARGASSLWFAGDVAELAIYSRRLTASELTTAQLTLAYRYDVAIG